MKKPTIIALFILFFASVFVVGVFGMKSIPYNERVYVNKILFDESKVYANNEQKIQFNKLDEKAPYDYSVIANYKKDMVLVFSPIIEPATASNKNLSIYIVDQSINTNGSTEDAIEFDAMKKTVKINKPCSFQIAFKANDMPNGALTKIFVYVDENAF